MQLIGQKNNLELIKNWDRLPNFMIIQGEEHVGKSYFVLYLCKLFKLRYIKVGKTVKEIRNLIKVMTPNSNTVYHLDNFDDASLQAKNALLKITEEPVEGNYIIITGGPQIATLHSRARTLIMAPYSYDELKDTYAKYYSNLDSQVLYNVGINTPAKIVYYKDCQTLPDLLSFVTYIFDRITYIEPKDYVQLIKLFESRYEKDTIDLCALYLNMLIKLIENKFLESNQHSYLDILGIILQIKKQLMFESTLNRRLLLIKMFNRIHDLQIKGMDI